MSRIFLNAVSAKHGGARTIVESFVNDAVSSQGVYLTVYAGFPRPESLPQRISWHHVSKFGAKAMLFNLFSVLIPFIRYQADVLISFNNVNCVLLPSRKRITYFHQLKALDEVFSEAKLHIIRSYLFLSRETIILQTDEVKKSFEEKFGAWRHDILVAWPGISVPTPTRKYDREPFTLLVPVASPHSPHKNFSFVKTVARELGADWQVIITADKVMEEYLGTKGGNIRFIGTLSRDELFDWYRRATTVLMPSTHETIGLPIFEALSVGTPVVAFDAPYIRALREYFGIDDGLSLTSNPEDAADAIEMRNNDNISYKLDFRVGEWQDILRMAGSLK